jgi:uncharacterized membrane protein YeaQ/YmgE (transglycosylase-associated protein family)
MSIFGFFLFLIVASTCAFTAEKVVPNRVPGGFFTSVIFGVVGGFIGGVLIGPLGPELAGVALIPCLLGSAAFVLVLTLLANGVRKLRAWSNKCWV